jgi:hypothetical protein
MMKIKKINTKKITAKVNDALLTVKVSMTKANDYALNNTEEIVSETITMASQWQKVTEKALKGGVQLLDNQQNLIFDTLEMYKGHFVEGQKRFTKIFAKLKFNLVFCFYTDCFPFNSKTFRIFVV